MTDPLTPDTPAQEAVGGRVYCAMVEIWGERCHEYDPGCSCCAAWAEYDRMTEAGRQAGLREAAEEAGIVADVGLSTVIEDYAKGYFDGASRAVDAILALTDAPAEQPDQVAEAAKVLLWAMETEDTMEDPFDPIHPEIEALAVKYAGNRLDGVGQLEIAEDFFTAALRALAGEK